MRKIKTLEELNRFIYDDSNFFKLKKLLVHRINFAYEPLFESFFQYCGLFLSFE